MEVMDEESGAFSWEAFTAFGQVAMAQAKRREGSASLIVVSVDELRDSFSSAGISVEATAVLVVASVLLRQVRSSDMVGRHGPRSFAVLAQDAGQAGVMRLAERIHAALPEKLSGLHGPVPFTVSMGIATMPDAGTNLPAVLRCAEDALAGAAGDGGNRVRISGETRAVVPIGVDRFAEKRQASLSRLIQAFERGDVEGIAIRTRPGVCTVCLETAREIYKPDWVPVPPLPLPGCTSPGGCRCLYSAPSLDPRRSPPPLPIARRESLEVPRRLRKAAEFGSNPRHGCKPEELAEYLEAFPLLPFQSDVNLRPGEVAYLVRPARSAWERPESGSSLTHGPLFPLEGAFLPWVKRAGKPPSLPSGALQREDDGMLYLTNWRIIFSRRGAITSTLLIDLLGLEYLRAGIACTVAGENNRLVLLLREPLQCGLLIARAVRDLAIVDELSLAT